MFLERARNEKISILVSGLKLKDRKMLLTKKEIQDKSDKKRGVRMTGFKLHKETINKLNSLQDEFNMSKTQLVTEGINRMDSIVIEISNQCQEKHFYASEYAAFLYEKLSHLYPNAKLAFTITNESATSIIREYPYIIRYEVCNGILQDVESVCESVCSELIEKCKDRRLHSSPSPIPSIYHAESRIEKIFQYLESKGVKMFTRGWFNY